MLSLGNGRWVKELLSRRELDPNAADVYGVCALHKAVSFGQVTAVQHLLADHEESQVYLAFSALSSEFTLAFASIGSQHAIDSSVAEE